MRTRDLRPGFFRNTELRSLPYEGRLLFAGLWCMADKRGRLKDDPALIKAEVFPSDNVKIDRLLTGLIDKGLIERYEAQGLRCIWIPTFHQHQHPHPKEPESVLPCCPSEPIMTGKAAVPQLVHNGGA